MVIHIEGVITQVDGQGVNGSVILLKDLAIVLGNGDFAVLPFQDQIIGDLGGVVDLVRQEEVVALVGEGGGLDFANLRLKHPVAAEVRRAGQVVRGRHVRAGEFGKGVDEGGPFRALPNLTAVEQEVRVFGQGVGPRGELVRVVCEGIAIDPGIAEGQAAGRAVGQDMDGGDAREGGQGFRNLRDAVTVGVEEDGGRGLGLNEEGLVVVEGGIDEDDRWKRGDGNGQCV